MIRLDRVAKRFGGRELFSDIGWTIGPGERIGLVGPNGSGKTTLFRMLAGQIEPDEGRVMIPSETTIGWLPQDVGDVGQAPLIDFVLEGRPDLVEMETRIEALTERAGEGDRATRERVGEEIAELSERFRTAGGYAFRARASSILSGMGFTESRHHDPADTLSGGWRVRLVLARLLLQQPDVLLMDEPTNHLDMPSVEWLEDFLSTYDGTVVLISHDRWFLNRLVTSIAALEPQGLYVHPGNYDSYTESFEERAELLQKQWEKQQKEIAATERFIERFRAKATKAKQVQSRVKQLEKLDRVQTMEQRRRVRGFRFAEAPRSGKTVCELNGVDKAYGDLSVYDGLDVTLYRGERVAVVGPNGAGKSTMLKIIVEQTPIQAGEVTLGHNVIPAYFGQHQVDQLDLDATLLEEMERHAPYDEIPRCRGILGAFLFSGEDVDKKIHVLSGGERNRLALAKLLLRPTNLLLLDEPTNHLDMDSRDVLLQALDAYDGTLIVVSHDRHFVNKLATRVVHVEDGKVTSYPGNYDYYRSKRAELSASRAAEEARRSAASTSTPTGRKERKRREAEFRQALSRRTGDKRKRLDKLESTISEFEAEQERLETSLANPDLYVGDRQAEVEELQRALRDAKTAVTDAYYEWGQLSEELEAVEAQIRRELGMTD